MFSAYFDVIKKYATFSGRTRRRDYWYFSLVNYVITFVFSQVMNFLDAQGNQVAHVVATVYLIYCLFFFIPCIALCVRRLHDTGKSAGYLMWLLLPVVGTLIVAIRMAFFAGEYGDNLYGEDPKR